MVGGLVGWWLVVGGGWLVVGCWLLVVGWLVVGCSWWVVGKRSAHFTNLCLSVSCSIQTSVSQSFVQVSFLLGVYCCFIAKTIETLGFYWFLEVGTNFKKIQTPEMKQQNDLKSSPK